MARMDNIGWDCRETFFGQLVKISMTKYAAGIRVLNCGLVTSKTTVSYIVHGQWTICSHPKSRKPWSFKSRA